jgi:hypothetical protein
LRSVSVIASASRTHQRSRHAAASNVPSVIIICIIPAASPRANIAIAEYIFLCIFCVIDAAKHNCHRVARF